ncbi:MAG: hypothetical protein FJX75_21730 [Armatimonadetes bacterium]|nr:hypothetical protein [Armatimonadota bacterium]
MRGGCVACLLLALAVSACAQAPAGGWAPAPLVSAGGAVLPALRPHTTASRPVRGRAERRAPTPPAGLDGVPDEQPVPDSGACPPPSLQVVVGAPIQLWGQGHTSQGLPANVPQGATPTFTGGSTSDRWLNRDVRAYALGAVGRTDLTVFAGVEARVRVVAVNLALANSDSPSASPLPATAWIGDEQRGRVRLYSSRGKIEPTGPSGRHMWLYVLAQRKGLSDVAGTYQGTVVVEIMPD